MSSITPERQVDRISQLKKNKARGAIGLKPGWLGYTFLAIVMAAAIYPIYWAFTIGSGDQSTITKREFIGIPGPNFIDNALEVMNSPTVNFWNSILNSIIVDKGVIICLFSSMLFLGRFFR